MSLIVDSSVVVAALVDSGEYGQWAEQVLAAGPAHAPELVRVEVANVLRRLERSGQISSAEANAAFANLLDLKLETFPFEPFADRIWALRHTVTSYDAWYVALAEFFDLPLATLDDRLVHATGPRCRFHLPPKSTT